MPIVSPTNLIYVGGPYDLSFLQGLTKKDVHLKKDAWTICDAIKIVIS